MSDGEAGILRGGRGRVLVVDDDADVCALLEARLAGRGFEVAWTTSAAAALDSLAGAEVDAILTDIQMARMSGLELCERIAASRPDLPVVVMTAFGTLEAAIAAIRAGAYDFVTKPVEIDALVVALERAVQHRMLRSEVERLRRVVDDAEGFGELFGASAPMKRVYDLLERVVSSDATVLVTGESGTGKELVARALQERTVRPVGADHEVTVDVRIVAATNRDLEAAVEEGRLREDLYFRLNVIRIELPPLRVRGRDILLLAQRFADHYAREMKKPVCGLSPAVAERLLAYAWPGNVRELQNCMERAVALSGGARIGVDDLPEAIRTYRHTHVVVAGDDPEELVTLEEVEWRYIQRVMEAVGGHRTRAAEVLGLDRKTLYRKLDRYGREQPARS